MSQITPNRGAFLPEPYYFGMEAGMDACRPGGFVSFMVPAHVMKTYSKGAELREWMQGYLDAVKFAKFSEWRMDVAGMYSKAIGR